MTAIAAALLLSVGCSPDKTVSAPPDVSETDVGNVQDTLTPDTSGPDAGPDIAPPPTDSGNPPPAPDLKAMGAFLDERATLWIDNRKCALSCHTTVPFMMVQPLLSPDSLSVVQAIVLRVEERVEKWPNVAHFYPGQPEATEAVLNAVALLNYDTMRNQAPALTTCKAVEAMWQSQRADGGFDWWSFNLYPFELSQSNYWAASLVSVALAQAQPATNCDAAAADAPALKKLHSWLAQNQSTTDAHGQLWYLLANRAWAGALIASDLKADMLTGLRAKQRSDGGFGLKDFLPLDAATQSDAYTSALAGVVLAAGDSPEDAAAAARVHTWMSLKGDLASLQQFKSPNKPNKPFNNALFSDTNVAYWLWYQAQINNGN